MSHTPTPWREGRPGAVVADTPIPEMSGSDAVAYYGGHLVCESVTSSNRAHIVKCVNAHDELVAALSAIQKLAIEPHSASNSERIVHLTIDALAKVAA
jgi:hypothetical protein